MRKIITVALMLVASHIWAQAWNSPYKDIGSKITSYSSFAVAPKTLDPATTYSSDAIMYLAQIVEPPLQYAYLERPYKLIPLSAEKYLVHNHAAGSTYILKLRQNSFYAPHPAFVRAHDGKYLYSNLSTKELAQIKTLQDFKKFSSANMQASDFVYAIKRLADPRLHCPIYGILSKRIIGFSQLHASLLKYEKENNIKPQDFVDLDKFNLSGVSAYDKYTLRIQLKVRDPQFKYWLAMPFFAPVPRAVDLFYSQAGLRKKHIGFMWSPVGTGPYFMRENDPNRQIVLEKNPKFWGEKYPSSANAQDTASGLLENADRTMPFIERVVFSKEKENIPRWNKFLQGYVDKSGISNDSFDQAIRLDGNGNPVLTQQMRNRGIKFTKSISPSIYYIGFNMRDKVVGGSSKRARLLRQAISIAINYEEYISIFLNGRGVVAHSPLPNDIVKTDYNKVTHNLVNGRVVRKDIKIAKILLDEAGYKNGIDPSTGRRLQLSFDAAGTGSPDDKARLAWMTKQFKKLNIQLNIRASGYNRFQERVRTGQTQMFNWGWMADYPDAENFLFLLYGPHSKLDGGGENASNYNSAKFNALYSDIIKTTDQEKRQVLVQQAVAVLQQDAPWVWGFNPINYALNHSWVGPSKAHGVANNTLKYQSINIRQREQAQRAWNKPSLWPFFLIAFIVLILAMPMITLYKAREKKPRGKFEDQ